MHNTWKTDEDALNLQTTYAENAREENPAFEIVWPQDASYATTISFDTALSTVGPEEGDMLTRTSPDTVANIYMVMGWHFQDADSETEAVFEYDPTDDQALINKLEGNLDELIVLANQP